MMRGLFKQFAAESSPIELFARSAMLRSVSPGCTRYVNQPGGGGQNALSSAITSIVGVGIGTEDAELLHAVRLRLTSAPIKTLRRKLRPMRMFSTIQLSV